MKSLLIALFVGCWVCCEASPAGNDGKRVFVDMTDGDRNCSIAEMGSSEHSAAAVSEQGPEERQEVD